MKKTFKLTMILVLILTMAAVVLGCTNKTPGKTTTPGKQMEQKKPDREETPEDKIKSSLFDMIEYGDSYVVTSYKGSQKQVTIPSKYKGKKVVGIWSHAFANSSIKSITIPSTVEKIGSNAFYKCYALQAVTLNEGLKEIGKSVFEGTSIEEITIPATVEKVDSLFGDVKIRVKDGNAKYEAIDNCLIEKATKKLISGGKYSVIPDGVKEIGKEAFCGTSIESATIPSTVEKIGLSAFFRCKKLKTVTLNEGLKEIGGTAFQGTSIESITIPSTVEKIESLAFGYCTKLKTVTLNEGLKKIEFNAFQGTSIESITIPSTVEGIRFGAFSGCSKLTQIDCKLRKSYVESNRNDFRGLLEKESIINWLNG